MADASAQRITTPARADQVAASAALSALVEPGLLATAAAEARRAGVGTAEWLAAAGHLDVEAYYSALAHRLGLPFMNLPPRFDAGAPPGEVLQAGVATILDRQGRPGWLVAPEVGQLPASVFRWRLAGRSGRPVFLTTPARLEGWCLASRGRHLAQHAVCALAQAYPGLSAAAGVSRRQAFLMILSVAAVALALLGVPWLWLPVTVVCGSAFAAASLVRLCATSAGLSLIQREPRPLADDRLPVYSVLVPLYREARILPQLMRAIDRIDYPRAKLDVRLIVEAEDRETRTALSRIPLPPWCRVLVAPPGAPRTKPRAMQIALPLLRGSLVTVFDAEDEPDPQQLRRAAARFAVAPQTVACLQARLAIDNVDDGPLATLFALEYAALFDVVNPGLAALGWPILLGGTSNHFRTAALRRIGGWDAWNVTEDADLGLRLARFGYAVETLASTTDEEAPARLGPWLAQRRRWLKGWMQTILVHASEPRRVTRELGLLNAIAAFGTLAGGVLGALFGPLFIARTIYDMIFGDLLLPVGPWRAAESTLVVFLLVCGLAAIALPLAAGMRRRGLLDCWPVLWMLPVYYLLVSVAAWRAVIDLLRDPFHWAKTEHGLARSSRRAAGNTRPSAPSPQATPVRQA